jgi:hypothetical protein
MMRRAHFGFTVGTPPDELHLYLRRRAARAATGARAVVLCHGGNTSGDTYLVPGGGLAGYLEDRGFDVWILEWRSSPHIVDPLIETRRPLGGSAAAECKIFNFDRAIAEDFPTALGVVRREIGPDAELAVLGHCLGSCALAMAVARGALEPFDVTHVVLSTVGLFVRPHWKTWIKAENFILERVLQNDPQCRGINPKNLGEWPRDMRAGFDHWPRAWLPSGNDPASSLLRTLTFMFGQPYAIERLHPSLRGADVARLFGRMHLGLYLHASQMVRRGFAGPLDAPDVADSPGRFGDLDPTWFAGKRVTLLAAGQDQTWHRESIDLMYEWLRGNAGPADRQSYRKHVFPDYRLQELLWGERAQTDVFPVIAEALASHGLWSSNGSNMEQICS